MSEFYSFDSTFSGYKSWGKLKAQMEERLCLSLKNKITYFYTRYHKHRGSFGRATINYDKKELLAFSWDIGIDIQWKDEYTTHIDEESAQNFKSVADEQAFIHEKLMKEKWMPDGTLCHKDFIYAAVLFLQTDIESALYSDNYILRIFSYMDRRVGKRTLVKIKDDVEALPEWVKQFYRIRCEAEGL